MFGTRTLAALYRYRTIGKAVSLTEAAAKTIRLKRGAQTQHPQYFLRLDIEAGGTHLNNAEGCEGYRYKFRYDSSLSAADCVLQQADGKDNAVLFATEDANLRLLEGCLIDHEDKMMRSSFFVKDNPMAEVSCSCKTSFSPKEDAFKPSKQT